MYGNLIWLGLTYCAYIPFIIWWEPYTPKWFVIPNLFFIGLLAQVWSRGFKSKINYAVSGGLVMIIALANFSYTIWPRHSLPNPKLQLAQCFTEHATNKDTIIATDWSWIGYTGYFFDYAGAQIFLVGNVADKPRKVQLITESLVEANKKGGHVYLQDLSGYSPDELKIIEILTGFTPADFGLYEQRYAFSCYDSKFIELVQTK
jgi:hypothetical protein